MTAVCRLEQVAGGAASCPGERCPFWEPGGAVLWGRCAFEGLDLTARPEAAEELLHVRVLLESAASEGEARVARHLFHAALVASVDD